MNAINALKEMIGSSDDARRERVMSAIAESGLSDADLESVIGAMDDGFHEHLKAKGVTSDLARCSFCHRTQREVKTLVIATQAAICDQCIEIARDTAQRPKDGAAKRPWFSWR